MSEAPQERQPANDARPAEPLDRPSAEVLARTLRAVADPTRIQLLSMLVGSPEGRATVKDLVVQLEFRQPTISHHLKIMFDEGILDKVQSGRQVRYSISARYRPTIEDLLR
ncbi:ArsR/SmtB family transcription factor [Arthrobacter tecti]